MIAAVGHADHRVVGAADGQARRVRDEGGREGGAGVRTLDVELAHVRQVEQADALADGSVLLEDRAVLDGHQPAAELDQPRAEVAVDLGQRRLVDGRLDGLGHGSVSVDRSSAAAGSEPSDEACGARDEVALRLEGQHRRRLGEGDPADLLEFVVVVGQVAADRLHHEVVDGLVDALPRLDEPVLDRVERAGDPDLEPRLLGDLAQRGLLAGLARLGRALGQRPGPAVTFATPAADHQPRSSGLVADDDAAGGRGGRGPQADHGADAARGRRGPAPDRPERAHCITTRGPS